MTLEELKNVKRAVGIKQVTKSLEKDRASLVFLAADADERVVMPLREMCRMKGIVVEAAASMKELGKACQIEVGAAAVAVLRQE
ncbi:L7Ae/L30e/S12e/Gadd45 family ribosomal protein [Azotosporobacter soli]|uniref:L7Ae/L30e/S12e/Gadd45 family ribosomal protein n=1 Tax=Azotosporobacter soli TaxID=3055040 RepID=UPI0031FE6915